MHTLLQRDQQPPVDQVIEMEPHSRLPRLDLGIDWESPRAEFISSLRGVVSGPRAPKEAELTKDRGFHVDWIRGRVASKAFAASSLWHIAVIWLLILPIWGFLPEHAPTLAPVQIEWTWNGQQPDLPRISLPASVPVPREKPKNIAPRVPGSPGADASRARQTILSIPVRITHPRQTLIRPDAPSAPPRVVPQLPNIVQWSSDQPQKPKFQLSVANSAPKIRRRRRAIRDDAAPEVPNPAKNLVPFNIASKTSAIPRPKMPVSAMSAPVARQHETRADASAAPEIGAADSSSRRIIALSATPAPPAPAAEVPAGNVTARISTSPDGKKPGAVANAANHSTRPGGGAAPLTTGGTGAGSNGSLPAAISITGGGKPSSRGGIAPLASRLNTLNLNPPNSYQPPSNSRRGPPNVSALDPSLPPEKILSGSEVYTMHVNLPNLTSASGSWILSFSELDEDDGPSVAPKERLAGPVPIRKADPKYPPDMIKAHVQGEVVLYAIIRKDGSVDSIQVVRGLDPKLDQNAIQALSEWKFRPATRAGHPVDVEAIVHIPFVYQDPRGYGSR